jgi:hypothetical protein
MVDVKALLGQATPLPDMTDAQLVVWDRFLSHVDMTDECWVWTGARSPLGYGRFKTPERTVQSHRYAWSIEHGRPIPDGLEVAHHCDNPPCVRVKHLFLATRTDNEQDKIAKGRHNPRGFRQITHCPQGHVYDEANTRISGGSRVCKTCQRNRWRERYGVVR